MLIIFDLDDTLVQTSRTFTPSQLKKAVVKMAKEGLALPNLMDAIDQIQRMDAQHKSAKETLSAFLQMHGAEERFFSIGCHEIYEDFSFTEPLLPMENAREVLLHLRQKHVLALVTAGNERNQKAKLENAGIDSRLFSKIIVCEKHEKGFHYQELAEEFRVFPDLALVCGDRVQWDLSPAKKLGMQTVLIMQGRGRHESPCHRDVDFSIWALDELKGLVKQ